MEFEKIPTIPLADELLDRSFRRAAAIRKLKRNKHKADEDFIRAVASSIHDKLEDTVKKFPSFERLSPFYLEAVDILFGVDRMKQSLGALTWAGDRARAIGYEYADMMKDSNDTPRLRKQATARISSIVNQVASDLKFLNHARNVLRKLPEIRDEFTVVIAGYPNVGKSSFIRLISSADPEVAGYAFTTKGVIVGHRAGEGRERIQIIDTPGILDRPDEERNEIERQAISAVRNVADLILFILDASESCGYSLDAQLRLCEEIKMSVGGDAPVEVVINKCDLKEYPGYLNMSTEKGDGVEEVIELIMTYLRSTPSSLLPPTLE